MSAQKAKDPWKGSRSGAWASRGFHYQHLVATLIMIQQWAGISPSGSIVPEGLEDCVVELPGREIWIQAKSRKTGAFSEAELGAIYASVAEKIAARKAKEPIGAVAVFEQPCTDVAGVNLGSVLDSSPQRKLVICSNPGGEIITLLLANLPVANIIAEGIASDLYKLVADASQQNASLTFDKRRRISTTEVERRIFERLEAEDPSAIDSALLSGAVRPVDFTTPVAEPGFYQGVKVAPGHVAAGLVVPRPDETNNVVRLLRRRRQVLVSGPSGAGKSALIWLTANSLCGDMRWYQITATAVASDAESVARFIRARRPSESSPIGVVFDEVNSANSDLWDVLVAELRALSSVYFMGSIRQEDMALIASRSDAEFIPISLDRKLAETVWTTLKAEGLTTSIHWVEPYEQSLGLMLEYVHFLTQGKRLVEVIKDQVDQREREGRFDELAIIRTIAVISARGGEIAVNKLLDVLGLSESSAHRALKRLIDEHIVRESSPGILGGLHLLRSEALEKAAHDGSVFVSTDTLWHGLAATTTETMPQVIRAILRDAHGPAEIDALQKLAKTLATNFDNNVWVSVLTGLGFATLERSVSLFVAMLEQHGVQRGQWSFASMFADLGIVIPELAQFEQWQKIRDAVLAFRALPKQDLRRRCLDLLPRETQVPVCRDFAEANKLLSCLVPLSGGAPISVDFKPEFHGAADVDVQEIAALLATAQLLGEDMALKLNTALGGEEVLLAQFHAQTPWITVPIIEKEGPHGRTVRADVFYISDQLQHDMHGTVCTICDTLIALSPDSTAAASDAINPKGQTVSISGFTPWSKNMPRENIPAKSRVAWNVAFRQIVLARATANSLSEYSAQMGDLVRKVERIFRNFTEKWISGKTIPKRDALAADINSIIENVNALAYATPGKAASEMTSPGGGAGADDTLGALVIGVIGNLTRRMGSIPGDNAKAAAMFAASLSAQAREHQRSAIWRTMSSPPLSELAALSERLEDVSSILHEFAHDSGPAAVQRIVAAAKRSSLGKAVRGAARTSRLNADHRFSERLRALEVALRNHGWVAQCLDKRVKEKDSVHWPPQEVAVLIEIEDFVSDSNFADDALRLGNQVIGTDWSWRIVPVIKQHILSSMALKPSQTALLPDLGFEEEWADDSPLPFQPAGLVQNFNAAISACATISGILTARGLEKLHADEEKALIDAKAAFEADYEILVTAAKGSGAEHLELAIDYLSQTWGHVSAEIQAVETGEPVEGPLCMDVYVALQGGATERMAEVATVRLLMLQGECIRLVDATAAPNRA